jgi:hypothetical protein
MFWKGIVMKITKFLYLFEAPMASELAGTAFERKVFEALLPYVAGVNKIVKTGATTPTDVSKNEKTISITKPREASLANIRTGTGIYDLNKMVKLAEGYPDFIVKPLTKKLFLGYDSSKYLYIEAKSTTTGRFKSGQITPARLSMDRESQIYKYLSWFALRKEIDWDVNGVVQEFNAKKKEMLLLFKVCSGEEYRLILAVNEGSEIVFLAVDDTIDLLNGSFQLSDKNVLRFVHNEVPLFILERVDKVGGIRMYSKEQTLKTKGQKLSLAKNEEKIIQLPARAQRIQTTNERLSITFKVNKTIRRVSNPNTTAKKPNEVLATRGQRIVIEGFVPTGRSKKMTLAAGTEIQVFDKYLTEFEKEVKCFG